MNEKTIKTGDVVTLNSGGPPMTVGGVGPREETEHLEALPEGVCVCAWFCTVQRLGADIYGEPQRGVFHVDMLKKVEAGELRAAAEAVYASLTDHGEVEPHKVTIGRALGKAVA